MSQELIQTRLSKLLEEVAEDIDHVPLRTIQSMKHGEVLQDEERRVLLGYYSATAGRFIKKAQEIATAAILQLDYIHEYRLWEGDYPSYKAFREEWCDHYSWGRTTTYNALAALRVWEQFGREKEELLEVEGGINAVTPLLYGGNAVVDQYAEDGTVLSLKHNWETILRERFEAPDDSPHLLAQRYANELIHAKATGRTVRSELRQDKDAATDRIRFYPVMQNDMLVNVHWKYIPASGRLPKDGYGIESMNKVPAVRNAFCKALGSNWNEDRGGET